MRATVGPGGPRPAAWGPAGQPARVLGLRPVGSPRRAAHSGSVRTCAWGRGSVGSGSGPRGFTRHDQGVGPQTRQPRAPPCCPQSVRTPGGPAPRPVGPAPPRLSPASPEHRASDQHPRHSWRSAPREPHGQPQGTRPRARGRPATHHGLDAACRRRRAAVARGGGHRAHSQGSSVFGVRDGPLRSHRKAHMGVHSGHKVGTVQMSTAWALDKV